MFILAFLLGLRHGIDWDHIAAISDIAGTAVQKKGGFLFGFFYALGHALVIFVLGLAVIFIGIRVPAWVDRYMEPFVGITLIILGLWLFYSIFRHGKNFAFNSRWMILFKLINKVLDYIHKKIAHKHHVPHIHLPETYGKRTAFTVGFIHGIGAETPTQVMLFAAAAGGGGLLSGFGLLFAFITGLLLSNSLLVLISSRGFIGVQKNSTLYLVLGVVTALFSLFVGAMFLFHRSAYLPAILGG